MECTKFTLQLKKDYSKHCTVGKCLCSVKCSTSCYENALICKLLFGSCVAEGQGKQQVVDVHSMHLVDVLKYI